MRIMSVHSSLALQPLALVQSIETPHVLLAENLDVLPAVWLQLHQLFRGTQIQLEQPEERAVENNSQDTK